jgi:RNA polymerase-binding transcription factor DksA
MTDINTKIKKANNMERNSDPSDQASDLEDAERKIALEVHRNKSKPKQVKEADGQWPHEECLMCGNEIGLDRLEATGAVTCVECQSACERKGKNYAS